MRKERLILHDLLAVWPEGQRFTPTSELIELLAAHRPEAWGEGSHLGKPLTPQAVSRLIRKSANVSTTRLERHGQRGYLLAAIEQATASLPEMSDNDLAVEPQVNESAQTRYDREHRHGVYRHYDAAGNLLYVGVARDPFVRTSQHRRNAAWFDLADRYECAWFSTRAEALEAEEAAIQTERPIFNKMHGDAQRDSRAVAYLARNSAWHLLEVAV